MSRTNTSPSSDIDRCQKLDLPPNGKHVPIFPDREARIRADGRGNSEFTTLYLKNLKGHQRILRWLGKFKTVYITDSSSSSSEMPS